MGKLQDAWNVLRGKALPLMNVGQPFASYTMMGGTYVGIAEKVTLAAAVLSVCEDIKNLAGIYIS